MPLTLNILLPPGGTAHQPLQASSSLQLSDEQIKASLLSAVEDKMRRRLREIWAQSQVSLL